MRSFHEGAFHEGGAGQFAPVVTDYVEDVVLAADTLLRVPIPTGAAFVLFSFDADFRAKVGVINTALALPTTTTSSGLGSMLNPSARRIPDKLADGSTPPTHICLRAPAACKGSLEFYA